MPRQAKRASLKGFSEDRARFDELLGSVATKDGYAIFADEVGRGPLFGPVTVAAIALPLSRSSSQAQQELFSRLPTALQDSKKLSFKTRENLAPQIKAMAISKIAHSAVQYIDEYNINKAIFRAFDRILGSLQRHLDWPIYTIAIDGNYKYVPPSHLQISDAHIYALPKADAYLPAVSAASVLAKVARDRLMLQADKRYPGYGLARNMGYGTNEHRRALEIFGPTPKHRKTYLKFLQ